MGESSDLGDVSRIDVEEVPHEQAGSIPTDIGEWHKSRAGFLNQITDYFRISKKLTVITTFYILAVLLGDGLGVLVMDTVALSVLIGANGGVHILNIISRVMGNIASGS